MSASEASFTEVPAQSVAVCWKCRGAGFRLVKAAKPVQSTATVGVTSGEDTLKTASSACAELPPAPKAPLPVLENKQCTVCNGSGQFGRKRKRVEDKPPRPVKEFPDWVPVGPEPAGEGSDPTLALQPGEDLSYLAGKWKIFQHRSTHRYSTDDVVTAWVAARVAPLMDERTRAGVLRYVDIGCGIGSVLMMCAWLLPHATCLGIEAQPPRAAQAARSVRFNGIADRVTVKCGDLRDPTTIPTGSLYDLITGTPPYFNVAEGALPGSEESARCLFEYRGGIEAYCVAAARLLAPHGLFVVCESAFSTDRSYLAADAAGLRVLARIDAIPKEGKPPLFVVFVMELAANLPTYAPIAPQQFASTGQAPYHADIATTSSASKKARSEVNQPDSSTGPAGDTVIRLVVRDQYSVRTPFYKALLAELGKPG